jgi:hypothetical protein
MKSTESFIQTQNQDQQILSFEFDNNTAYGFEVSMNYKIVGGIFNLQ